MSKEDSESSKKKQNGIALVVIGIILFVLGWQFHTILGLTPMLYFWFSFACFVLMAIGLAKILSVQVQLGKEEARQREEAMRHSGGSSHEGSSSDRFKSVANPTPGKQGFFEKWFGNPSKLRKPSQTTSNANTADSSARFIGLIRKKPWILFLGLLMIALLWLFTLFLDNTRMVYWKGDQPITFHVLDYSLQRTTEVTGIPYAVVEIDRRTNEPKRVEFGLASSTITYLPGCDMCIPPATLFPYQGFFSVLELSEPAFVLVPWGPLTGSTWSGGDSTISIPFYTAGNIELTFHGQTLSGRIVSPNAEWGDFAPTLSDFTLAWYKERP